MSSPRVTGSRKLIAEFCSHLENFDETLHDRAQHAATSGISGGRPPGSIPAPPQES